MDVVFLVAVAGFFLLSGLMVIGCRRLQGAK